MLFIIGSWQFILMSYTLLQAKVEAGVHCWRSALASHVAHAPIVYSRGMRRRRRSMQGLHSAICISVAGFLRLLFGLQHQNAIVHVIRICSFQLVQTFLDVVFGFCFQNGHVDVCVFLAKWTSRENESCFQALFVDMYPQNKRTLRLRTVLVMALS